MACHTGRFGFLSRAVLGLALMAVGGAVAAEQVEVLRVQQRYPWNGLVDVDYAISGIDGDPCDYRIALSFTIETNGVPFTVVASNFNGIAACDLPTANGTWRVTWDTAADGVEVVSKKVKARIGLVYEPVAESEASYAIIDVSGGPSAAMYPVRYVKDPDLETSAFNIPLYKTEKIVLKHVSKGEFWMGNGNVSSGEDRHRVRLTKDYFFGVFPVTQRQYELVMGSNPVSPAFAADEPGNPAAQRPVGMVSFNALVAADAFLARIAAKPTSHGAAVPFALPTEAQWEMAARAGCEMKWPWYSDAWTKLDDYAWCNKKVSVTQIVGTKPENDWGFFDTLGNVMEWVSDWYADYPAFSETEVSENPKGPAEGTQRIVRGGSISLDRYYCYPGGRSAQLPTRSSDEIGFRLARTIP